MTYQQLLDQLLALTPEQLAQTVTIYAEDIVEPEQLEVDENGQHYFVATVC